MAATDPRIYFLLARTGTSAVVFRRGPTAQVLMLAWDRGSDTFEEGQWMKARVFERRCDLSPNGQLLVYCAQDYRRDPPVWTCISRPPWFTALATWPKSSSYGGGGQFTSNRGLILNQSDARLCNGSVPGWLEIQTTYGTGEDQPLLEEREVRDGWMRAQKGKARWTSGEDEPRLVLDPPIVHVNRRRVLGNVWTLVRELRGRFERQTGPYTERFRLECDGEVRDLGRCDQVEWDLRGKNPDLVFARGGRIWRWTAGRGGFDPDDIVELIDLRGCTFSHREAPTSAGKW